MNQSLIRYDAPSGAMAPRHSHGLFVEGGNGTAYLTLAAVCLAAFVYAFVADLLGEFGETARILAIVLTDVLTMTGAAICLFRGYLAAFFISVAGLLSTFLFLFIFSVNSGVPFTLISGGEYIGLTFTGLFYLTLKDRTYGNLMRWFYRVCVGYAAYYIVASQALRLGLINADGALRAIISADDIGRSDRLHSAALLLVYGTCYSMVMLRKHFSLYPLLLSALFCLAWFLTESRTATLVVFLALLLYLALGQTKWLKPVAKIVFYVGAIGSLFIIMNPRINPFLYFDEVSASVRVKSIFIVSDTIKYYWLQGAGIAFGAESYKPLTGITTFFPVDTGLIGIFYSYGIFGLLLYLGLCHLGLNSNEIVLNSGYNQILGDVCLLSGVIFAIYSIQSPQYNGGSSGSIFASMLIALFIYSKRRKKSERLRNPTLPGGLIYRNGRAEGGLASR